MLKPAAGCGSNLPGENKEKYKSLATEKKETKEKSRQDRLMVPLRK